MQTTWQCAYCTLENPSRRRRCGACDQRRGLENTASTASTKSILSRVALETDGEKIKNTSIEIANSNANANANANVNANANTNGLSSGTFTSTPTPTPIPTLVESVGQTTTTTSTSTSTSTSTTRVRVRFRIDGRKQRKVLWATIMPGRSIDADMDTGIDVSTSRKRRRNESDIANGSTSASISASISASTNALENKCQDTDAREVDTGIEVGGVHDYHRDRHRESDGIDNFDTGKENVATANTNADIKAKLDIVDTMDSYEHQRISTPTTRKTAMNATQAQEQKGPGNDANEPIDFKDREEERRDGQNGQNVKVGTSTRGLVESQESSSSQFSIPLFQYTPPTQDDTPHTQQQRLVSQFKPQSTHTDFPQQAQQVLSSIAFAYTPPSPQKRHEISSTACTTNDPHLSSCIHFADSPSMLTDSGNHTLSKRSTSIITSSSNTRRSSLSPLAARRLNTNDAVDNDNDVTKIHRQEPQQLLAELHQQQQQQQPSSSPSNQNSHHSSSLPANSDVENVGQQAIFKSAGSKSTIIVDKEQLQKASALLGINESFSFPSEKPNSIRKISTTTTPTPTPTQAFFQKAGSKSTIKVDMDQLQKAEALLQSGNGTNSRQPSSFVSTIPKDDESSNWNSKKLATPVFKTAGTNAPIQVSDKDLQNAISFLQKSSTTKSFDSFRGSSGSIPTMMQTNNNEKQKQKHLQDNTFSLHKNNRTSQPPKIIFSEAFHTAGSKSSIEVTQRGLETAELLLKRPTSTITSDCFLKSNWKKTSDGGDDDDMLDKGMHVPVTATFQTAGSKSSIEVTQRGLETAELLLKRPTSTNTSDRFLKSNWKKTSDGGDDDDMLDKGMHVPVTATFQTAGSKSTVRVSKDQLGKAAQMLKDAIKSDDRNKAIFSSKMPGSNLNVRFSDDALMNNISWQRQDQIVQDNAIEEMTEMPPTSQCVFAKSSGKMIDIPKKPNGETILFSGSKGAWRPTEMAKENSLASMNVFETAGSRAKIEVNEDQINHAVAILEGRDNDASDAAQLKPRNKLNDFENSVLNDSCIPVQESRYECFREKNDSQRKNLFHASLDGEQSIKNSNKLSKRQAHDVCEKKFQISHCDGQEIFEEIGNPLLGAFEEIDIIDNNSQRRRVSFSPSNKKPLYNLRPQTGHHDGGDRRDEALSNGSESKNMHGTVIGLDRASNQLQSMSLSEKSEGFHLQRENAVPSQTYCMVKMNTLPAVTPMKLTQTTHQSVGRKRDVNEMENDESMETDFTKMSNTKMKLEEAIQQGQLFSGEKEWSRWGVPQSIIQINSKNSSLLQFKRDTGRPSSFLSSNKDTALGEIGTVSDLRESLVELGVKPDLLSDRWILNQKRWIVWGYASFERSFCPYVGGRLLTWSHLLRIMKKRFQKEIIAGHRPALRMILNRDVAASLPVILIVCDISGLGGDGKKCINLSDGSYEVSAELDTILYEFIMDGTIRVGTKLLVSNAYLHGAEQGIDPLDPEYQSSMPSLVLKANCTRLAKWNAKPGFLKLSRADRLPFSPINFISDILPNGGDIPRLQVLVLRRFPIMYLEKVDDLKSEYLSEAEEEQRREEFERRRSKAIEKISEQMEKELEKEIDGDAPPLWTQYIQSGDADLHVLSEDERQAILTWTEKRQALLRHRLQEEVEAELQTFETLTRRSTPFLRLRVHSVGTKELNRNDDSEIAILTIWNPSEDQLDVMREGNLIEIQNVGVRSSSFDGILQLTLNGRSPMQRIKAEDLDNIHRLCNFVERKPLSIFKVHVLCHSVDPSEEDEGMKRLQTFDTAGVMVNPFLPLKRGIAGQEAYLTDETKLLLKIQFDQLPFELVHCHSSNSRIFAFDDLQVIGFDRKMNCAVARYSSFSSIIRNSPVRKAQLELWLEKSSEKDLKLLQRYLESASAMASSGNECTRFGYIVGIQSLSEASMLSIEVDFGECVESLILPVILLQSLSVGSASSAFLASAENRLTKLQTLSFLVRAQAILWRFQVSPPKQDSTNSSWTILDMSRANLQNLASLVNASSS